MRRLHPARSARAFAFGLIVAVALPTLGAGCGGSESAGGDANYSQKFEKPTGEVPAPKVRPAKASPKDVNDLSPRERRELGKARS
jgi:hypothetical protein